MALAYAFFNKNNDFYAEIAFAMFLLPCGREQKKIFIKINRFIHFLCREYFKS